MANGSIGCTNNNYASREKCKKCGQPKEVAAMPAIAIPGATLPTHSHYFARVQGGADQRMGFTGNGALQQSLPLTSNWLAVGADKYGVLPASAWSLGGNPNAMLPYPNPGNQLLSVPKGWRSGDWICSCGFHNYSSRAQCMKCNASPPDKALGTKRLASDEFVHDWDNKRLNIGHTNGQQQSSYPGFEPPPIVDSKPGAHTSYSNAVTGVAPGLQVPMLLPQLATPPTILGKGAKQWRDGDWMCTNCNNHNYASRSHCNRCKTEKEAAPQSVNAV